MPQSAARRFANAAGLAFVLVYSAADLWATVESVRFLWSIAMGW